MALLTTDPLLAAGLLAVDPALERYLVRPGGATVVGLGRR